MLVTARQWCCGARISSSFSFDVGIQKESLPLSTSDKAANSKMSSSMTRKLYGLLGGM